MSLPDRYSQWKVPVVERVRARLGPGATVLDVGAGRSPTIPRNDRPPGCTWVGLDVSAPELALAEPGSYDETCVADITERVPALEGRFDLVVSFQLLEHVKPLDLAFENIRSYLKPGGALVAQFSGRYSIIAVGSRLLPHRVAKLFLTAVLGRPAGTVFPAHYHRCHERALREILRPWAAAEIHPRYLGAGYLRFLPPAQRLYLVYEEWALRNRRTELATHYVVEAVR